MFTSNTPVLQFFSLCNACISATEFLREYLHNKNLLFNIFHLFTLFRKTTFGCVKPQWLGKSFKMDLCSKYSHILLLQFKNIILCYYRASIVIVHCTYYCEQKKLIFILETTKYYLRSHRYAANYLLATKYDLIANLFLQKLERCHVTILCGFMILYYLCALTCNVRCTSIWIKIRKHKFFD